MSSKLRIVMVCNAVMTASQRPIQWAVDAGHEVLVIAPTTALKPAPSNYHFRRRRNSIFDRRLSAEGKSLRVLGAESLTWIRAQRLRWLVNQFQPDLVHTHYINWHSYECAVAGFSPLIVSAWGAMNDLLSGETVKIGKRYQAVFDQASALIVESPYMAQRTQTILPQIPHHVNIPMGVDLDLFHPHYPRERAAWRHLWGMPSDALVFLSARGVADNYRHEMIVEAFAKTRSQFKQPAYLAIGTMGRGKGYKKSMQSIRNTVERCGVEPYVRWVEYHLFEAMPKLYAAVDVVVSYPYDDAFPSTLIEAAACGNYIVATDLPTYQGTFLEHYSSLAAADDVPALAQALHEAGNASPEWRMARVEKAREVIAAEYKEEVTRDRLLQLYADVAQKS